MTTRTGEQHPVHQLVQQWADAEQQGDHATLAHVLADDFVAVGPLGFVLTKEQWLQRHIDQALHYTSLRWTDLQVREHGQAVVVVGVQEQAGDYQDRDISGRFRGTLVALRPDAPDAAWSVAALHLSPIAPPPGKP
ncbi:MAG: nuclear transport factor 2 family protein [Actinomycetes bacterium]